MAKRVTRHNGRTGKDGVYSTKHNDRNYDYENDEHIDATKTKYNFKANYYCDENMTFDQVEKRYYEETFMEHLCKTNENYIKNRHKEKVRSMDDVRENEHTCPEETLYYIGNYEDHVDEDLLFKVYMEQQKWEHETFPQVVVLDMAFHCDEIKNAPHIHERKVWIAFDEDGNVYPSQSKALEQMGIESPNPTKKKTRFNNPKMTYTKACRDHFVELCKGYGIEIIEEPKEASKTGLSHLEYREQQAEEHLKAIDNDIQKALSLKAEVSVKHKKKLFDKEEKVEISLEDYNALKLVADNFSKMAEEFREKEKKLNEEAENWKEYAEVLKEEKEYVKISKERLEGDRNRFDYKVEEKAKEIHEEWMKETFGAISIGTKEKRLEDFCKSITFKSGKSIFDKFEEEERKLEEKEKHSHHHHL